METLEIFTTVIGAAIAIAVAYIAWNQYVTNRIRLRHELFDRNFDIYKATIAHIRRMEKCVKEMEEEDLRRMDEDLKWYRDKSLPAAFLLHRECSEYLEKLFQESVRLFSLSIEIRELTERLGKIEERSAAQGTEVDKELMERKKMRREIVLWFSRQVLELNRIFEKDLNLRLGITR